MKEKPLLSIIVPVYQAEEFLYRCMQSLLTQTVSACEVILVDDGSTDGSAALCDTYAREDSRVKVLHQRNAGPGAARNAGLAIAKGRWIGFVDADDWVAPDMYEKLLTAAKENKADVAFGQIVSAPNGMPSTERFVRPISKDAFWRRFFRIGTQECVYYVWNRVYACDLWRDVRFPEKIRNGEDVEPSFHVMAKAEKIVEVNDAFYYYYKNNKSITKSAFTPDQLLLLQVWERLVSACERHYPHLVDWARLNLARTDFTLLTRLLLGGNTAIDAQCRAEEACMRKRLKKNRSLLLRSPLPQSRKALMLAMTTVYSLTKKSLRYLREKRCIDE